jgi:hypothetical protein
MRCVGRIATFVLISVVLSGFPAAPVGRSLPSLIAPTGDTGTVGGIMNFANNTMSAVAPIVTGYIVGSTQSFSNAFWWGGCHSVHRHITFAFMPGRIEPIPDRQSHDSTDAGAS